MHIRWDAPPQKTRTTGRPEIRPPERQTGSQRATACATRNAPTPVIIATIRRCIPGPINTCSASIGTASHPDKHLPADCSISPHSRQDPGGTSLAGPATPALTLATDS